MKRLTTFSMWSFGFLACVLAFTAGAEPALAYAPLSMDTTGVLLSMAFGGILINEASLTAARTSFNTLFQSAFDSVEQTYLTVAMKILSTTSANDYKWFGEMAGIREWVGDKVVNNLMANGYYLANKDFELTIGVDRNSFKDDQLGIYSPLFKNIGDSGARHPDLLTWAAMVAGFTTGKCFDGLPFFSTAHPVDGVDAGNGTYANRPAVLGAGEPWFLIDDSRPIQPIIFQEREAYHFVSMDDPQNPAVFLQKKFHYGVEARVAIGYALPQLAYGSREALTPDAYEAARLAMSGLKRADGSPLGISGMTLIVGEGNFKAGNIILTNENDAAGATNPWKATAALKKIDHLTGQ